MITAPLDRDDVETLRRALNGCADDLMSTPPDGLAPEYVHAVELIAKGGGVQWPDTDILGSDLMKTASELEPDVSRLPEAIPPVLRPLAGAALERYGIEIEQEAGGDMDARSFEQAEVDRAELLVNLLLELAVRVDAKRWSGGWELYVLGSEDLVTQVEDIDDAPTMVRDLLETVFPGTDFSAVVFDVRTAD
ncbi:hypothetical protein [Brachybacterium atlanticum]|uniref:hypothetical protein n=1 Tax=Brachybacterium atlanticum TaxID=2911888 RepID=UPI0021E07699|nr:hypothetical protein [Brachybacterium atlanticum]